MLVVHDRYLRPIEHGVGFRSPVVRHLKKADRLFAAAEFQDKPARLTERQAEFLKLAIDLAQQLGSRRMPIQFESTAGSLILDKGCVKIAEHQRFLLPLIDDAAGLVSTIELSFHV